MSLESTSQKRTKLTESALVTDRPKPDDLDEIFEIHSDPRVWTHFPSGRMTVREEAESFLLRRIADRDLTEGQLEAALS